MKGGAEKSMRLGEFFATIEPVLVGRAGVAETAAALGLDARRLAVYATFCDNHRRDLLASIYPGVRRALGARWAATYRAFFLARPPRDWELNGNAAPFVEWLGAEVRAGRLPAWLVELADLEWWEWAVQVAPSAAPTFAGGAAHGVCAGAAVRSYVHDVVGWADAERRGLRAPARRASVVVFWRTAAGGVRRERARALELLAIKASVEGRRLREAALSAGVDESSVIAAAAALVKRGILVARSPRGAGGRAGLIEPAR